MSTSTDEFKASLQDVSDDVKALLVATSHVAEEKVVQARARLNAALAVAKDGYANFQTKAIAGAKKVDESIHENPYPAIGIAFGVGALIGYILGRRN